MLFLSQPSTHASRWWSGFCLWCLRCDHLHSWPSKNATGHFLSLKRKFKQYQCRILAEWYTAGILMNVFNNFQTFSVSFTLVKTISNHITLICDIPLATFSVTALLQLVFFTRGLKLLMCEYWHTLLEIFIFFTHPLPRGWGRVLALLVGPASICLFHVCHQSQCLGHRSRTALGKKGTSACRDQQTKPSEWSWYNYNYDLLVRNIQNVQMWYYTQWQQHYLWHFFSPANGFSPPKNSLHTLFASPWKVYGVVQVSAGKGKSTTSADGNHKLPD